MLPQAKGHHRCHQELGDRPGAHRPLQPQKEPSLPHLLWVFQPSELEEGENQVF